MGAVAQAELGQQAADVGLDRARVERDGTEPDPRSDAWNAASQWFPGLLLEALAAGGTADVSLTRALTLISLYVAVAVSAAAIVFARRDVTA